MNEDTVAARYIDQLLYAKSDRYSERIDIANSHPAKRERIILYPAAITVDSMHLETAL